MTILTVRRVYAPRFRLVTTKIWRDGHYSPLGMSHLSGLGQTVLQLLDTSVLQLHFLQKLAGKSIFEAWGHVDPKTRREECPITWGWRERERVREGTHAWERERKPFGSSFYVFFPSPVPVLCKLGLGRSAVLKSSLRSSDLPLTFSILFSWAFPFLVFQPLLF